MEKNKEMVSEGFTKKGNKGLEEVREQAMCLPGGYLPRMSI